MRHKRRGILEVNLTSLLDVLFCILFIAMMANVENENDLKNESQQQVQQIQEQLNEQAVVYQNQIAAYEAQMESYDIYHTQAIVITMQNVQENSIRMLKIYEGLEKVERESILLGPNKTLNMQERLKSYFDEILALAINQPIYVVFHCDSNYIYTAESIAIDELLNEMAETNKELFYKRLTADE